MAFTIPNLPAANYMPQAQMFEADVDALVAAHAKTGVLTGCTVTAQGSPNMTVAVASGIVLVNNLAATVAAGNVTISAASGSFNRIDLIVASNTGVLSVVTGTAIANPIAPALPANSALLASIYVFVSATSITTTQITDRRVIFTAQPFYPTISKQTTTYTMATTDTVILTDSTSAAFTVTLFAAVAGALVIIKDSTGQGATHNITIVPASGTVDGAANVKITTNYGVVRLTSDGTNWFTI